MIFEQNLKSVGSKPGTIHSLLCSQHPIGHANTTPVQRKFYVLKAHRKGPWILFKFHYQCFRGELSVN